MESTLSTNPATKGIKITVIAVICVSKGFIVNPAPLNDLSIELP
jgi:hypothetical protein